ncbi:MAG: hypothetical protein K0S74_1626 [Chlamydiales bacterium]|jgi:hypothetical protein|nr:hypothetical protein [Chlamydiales bacterium]
MLIRQLWDSSKFAYICPDDICLKQMERTYKVFLKHKESILGENPTLEAKIGARKEAYDYWRPGSNAAHHFATANLIKENYDFYFGSTATAPQTAFFFKFLKDRGYSIRLLHVSAPDDIRWGSIKERDKEFVQTTEADIRDKAKMFPERIQDTYLKFADQIDFYYRNEVKGNAIHSAIWIRDPESTDTNKGKLEILESSSYEKIKELHNSLCKDSNREDILWEKTVEGSLTKV